MLYTVRLQLRKNLRKTLSSTCFNANTICAQWDVSRYAQVNLINKYFVKIDNKLL